MKPVVGVFKLCSAAQTAAGKLVPLGIPKDRISILTPDVTQTELAQVPIQGAEQPGMGKVVGATVGGAIGIAAGGTLTAILGSLLVPGVGPALAIGLAGGVLGAIAGGSVGGAVESYTTEGLPEDELFVYEDALGQGHSAVIAIAADDPQAEAIRGALEDAGAESIDRAREMWWIGLRDAEKEKPTRRTATISMRTNGIFVVASKPLNTPPIAANPTKSVAPASVIGIRAPTSGNPSSEVTSAVAPISKR